MPDEERLIHASPEPIPLRPKPPDASGFQSAANEWRDRAEIAWRRVRIEARRAADILRSASTPEGRQRNFVPLVTIAAAGAFILGLGLGLRRR